MDHPSPAEPRETSIVRTVLVTTGLASGSLVAGAVGMWLLVTVLRVLIHFVQHNWPWLVGVLVLVTVIAGGLAVLNDLAEYEAEQREERLRTIATFDRVDVMTGAEFEELIATHSRRAQDRRPMQAPSQERSSRPRPQPHRRRAQHLRRARRNSGHQLRILRAGTLGRAGQDSDGRSRGARLLDGWNTAQAMKPQERPDHPGFTEH
jgi:Tfp pilus assembly protein PilP